MTEVRSIPTPPRPLARPEMLMRLPTSLLQAVEFLLQLALLARCSAAQSSRFDITAHRTGYQYAAAEQLTADNLQVVTKDDLLVCASSCRPLSVPDLQCTGSIPLISCLAGRVSLPHAHAVLCWANTS